MYLFETAQRLTPDGSGQYIVVALVGAERYCPCRVQLGAEIAQELGVTEKSTVVPIHFARPEVARYTFQGQEIVPIVLIVNGRIVLLKIEEYASDSSLDVMADNTINRTRYIIVSKGRNIDSTEDMGELNDYYVASPVVVDAASTTDFGFYSLGDPRNIHWLSSNLAHEIEKSIFMPEAIQPDVQVAKVLEPA